MENKIKQTYLMDRDFKVMIDKGLSAIAARVIHICNGG
jgi:hypothetical protein